MKSRSRLFLLFLGVFLFSNALAYGFPIENRWKATVVGTPPGYRAELPEKIPLKKRRIEIFDREVPEALWFDQQLRYSYALQKDPAPLVFLIAGTGASYDGGKNTNMGKAFYDAGFHIVSLSSPTHMNFIVNASTTKVPGHIIHDTEDLYRVMELAYEHMNEPELVQIEPDKVTADRVRQAIFFPSNEDKLPLLVGLIREMGSGRIMVFVNMKRDAERVEATLEANGVHAKAISGDVPQKKRQSLLKRFQDGQLAILVATDVAARGLHIPDVSHVFNYDLPQDAEDYVHRIGRTARLGADGDAISFACERYVYSLPDIEAFIGHSIPVERVTDELLVDERHPDPKQHVLLAHRFVGSPVDNGHPPFLVRRDTEKRPLHRNLLADLPRGLVLSERQLRRAEDLLVDLRGLNRDQARRQIRQHRLETEPLLEGRSHIRRPGGHA